MRGEAAHTVNVHSSIGTELLAVSPLCAMRCAGYLVAARHKLSSTLPALMRVECASRPPRSCRTCAAGCARHLTYPIRILTG